MKNTHRCMDCNVNTAGTPHYYMVHDWLWAKVNPDILGMLCLDCLEQRLGRKLRLNDFTNAPVNWRIKAFLEQRA